MKTVLLGVDNLRSPLMAALPVVKKKALLLSLKGRLLGVWVVEYSLQGRDWHLELGCCHVGNSDASRYVRGG
jgi:hypothetical protein